MEHWKLQIAADEENIAGLKKDWRPLDLGIPDALGYAGGPNLYAFVLRDGRAERTQGRSLLTQ